LSRSGGEGDDKKNEGFAEVEDSLAKEFVILARKFGWSF